MVSTEMTWEWVDVVVCEIGWLAVRAKKCYMLSTGLCTGMCYVFFSKKFRIRVMSSVQNLCCMIYTFS